MTIISHSIHIQNPFAILYITFTFQKTKINHVTMPLVQGETYSAQAKVIEQFVRPSARPVPHSKSPYDLLPLTESSLIDVFRVVLLGDILVIPIAYTSRICSLL